MSEFQTEVGLAAGAVYRYLHEHGETSLSRLAKELDEPSRRVDHAIGWLAREGKITVTHDKRSTLIALR